MEVVIVLNAGSRSARSAANALPGLFAARGVKVGELHLARDSAELKRTVSAAAKAGVEFVVVGGGDGTVTAAADAVAQRDTALGIIPLGTGNSFARSLGIVPDDLPDAVEIIAGGRVAKVDLGVVNGTHFAGFATVGLGSIVARSTPRALKARLGPLAYAVAAIAPVLRSRGHRIRLKWPDGRTELQTNDVVVVNARLFGSTAIAPDAGATDGRLVVFAASGKGPLAAIRSYIEMGLGRQNDLPGAHTISTREVRIRARPRALIAIDGTPLMYTPAIFTVARGALRVLVPPSFDETQGYANNPQ